MCRMHMARIIMRKMRMAQDAHGTKCAWHETKMYPPDLQGALHLNGILEI